MVGCPNGQRLFTYSGYIMMTYCNSWHCPTCRRKMAHMWARNIYYGWCLWKPRPFYFVTLTMPGWMATPAEGYAALPGAWAKWHKAIQYQRGWHCYAAFVEEQREHRDMPHLHIITLNNLPSRLNEMALHAGFGYEAHNDLMSGMGAAYYAAKYATKNLMYAPPHFRRVRISQLWPKLPEPILPQDYIPYKPRETHKQYLVRVGAELGMDSVEVFDLWDNWACDIGAY